MARRYVAIMVNARNNIAETSVGIVNRKNVVNVGIGMNVANLSAAGGIRYLAKAQRTPSLLRDILLIWYWV